MLKNRYYVSLLLIKNNKYINVRRGKKMNWYLEVLKKYAVFEGRARRKEYWMFILFNVIFVILASIIIAEARAFDIILMIYLAAMIIPTISVTVRRLHDIGKSGFWIFIRLVPIIGGIWMLVLLCTEGQKWENIFGADPKIMNNIL